jgi:ribosomal protein S6--L-glutamate ligase
MNNSLDLGWEEWVSLPAINLPAIKAKIDTGAHTSVLHAEHIEVFKVGKKKYVRFEVSPLPEKPKFRVSCSAPLVGRRKVTSSNGESEKRYFIKTDIEISGQNWEIEISLTGRITMQYRMLIGRTSIGSEMTVHASDSFLNGQPVGNPYNPKRKKIKKSRRALRIALLTREPNNYTSKRIEIAASQRGHQVEAINSVRCYLDVDTQNPEIYYDSSPLPKYDVVIPRIGASITSYGIAVTRQFELTGAVSLNSPQSIANSRDKLLAHQLLASAKINMPVTGFASSPKDTNGIINSVGSMPLVIKLLESSQGKGVILAETKKAAETVIGAFRGLKANFLVQEYIGESKGEDLRCLVIDGKVVGSILRSNKGGDFRSNLHQGGVAESTSISRQERAIAVRAAKALGLSVAGVDILRSKRGPLVLEVNSSPGIQGIEKVLGIDVAGEIIAFCERKLGIISQ